MHIVVFELKVKYFFMADRKVNSVRICVKDDTVWEILQELKDILL